MRILTTPLSTLEVIQLVLKVTERRAVSSIVLSECQEGGKELGGGSGSRRVLMLVFSSAEFE